MIHQYKLNGYNIVLDVSSGAVHVVDDIAYDMIARFEEDSRENILAAKLEICEGTMGLGQPNLQNIAIGPLAGQIAEGATVENVIFKDSEIL